MKNTKYVTSGGLAFTEKGDMQKLSKYAKGAGSRRALHLWVIS